MKVKTSITLSEDLLDAIEQSSANFKNRSDFIEAAVRAYLAALARSTRDAKDRAILDRDAERLNDEAADVLEYQVIR